MQINMNPDDPKDSGKKLPIPPKTRVIPSFPKPPLPRDLSEGVKTRNTGRGSKNLND